MRLTVLAIVLFAVHAAQAHQSSIGIYDEENLVEIQGIVKSVRWRNPHRSYVITVTDENGQAIDWDIETGSVSTLRLRGVDKDFIQVGDRVRLAGQSSLRGLPEMFAQNLLLDNGEEVLLRAVSKPYWPAGLNGVIYERRVNEAWAEEGRRSADGIFRVWRPIFDDPEAYPLYTAGISLLTETAREIKAQWDPRNSPFTMCRPKAMPYIMASAYPIEFLKQGDDLLLRVEEFDTERLIHMNAPRASIPDEYSRLGCSRGYWDGETLVVQTEKIEASVLYTDGTPQSSAISLVERFGRQTELSPDDFRSRDVCGDAELHEILGLAAGHSDSALRLRKSTLASFRSKILSL
ncbi:MAG: DUF6152 family protein [Candidatus Rariloculaceae bacterium]